MLTCRSASMVTSASSVLNRRSSTWSRSTAVWALSRWLCLARSATSPPPNMSQVAQPWALSRLCRISSAVTNAARPAELASSSSFCWLRRVASRSSSTRMASAVSPPAAFRTSRFSRSTSV